LSLGTLFSSSFCGIPINQLNNIGGCNNDTSQINNFVLPNASTARQLTTAAGMHQMQINGVDNLMLPLPVLINMNLNWLVHSAAVNEWQQAKLLFPRNRNKISKARHHTPQKIVLHLKMFCLPLEF